MSTGNLDTIKVVQCLILYIKYVINCLVLFYFCSLNLRSNTTNEATSPIVIANINKRSHKKQK